MVPAGDQVPLGNVLATPAIEHNRFNIQPVLIGHGVVTQLVWSAWDSEDTWTQKTCGDEFLGLTPDEDLMSAFLFLSCLCSSDRGGGRRWFSAC